MRRSSSEHLGGEVQVWEFGSRCADCGKRFRSFDIVEDGEKVSKGQCAAGLS